MNLNLIRELLPRAHRETPFDIHPKVPFLDIPEKGEADEFAMPISIPKDEGAEFIHWRYLADLGLVRVQNDNRPGFGSSNNRVLGLTARGLEFGELSRDDSTWDGVLDRTKKAGACTVSIVVDELRKAARKRMSAIAEER
jgi:hypothetical protein